MSHMVDVNRDYNEEVRRCLWNLFQGLCVLEEGLPKQRVNHFWSHYAGKAYLF
jgi:hypothetical protein